MCLREGKAERYTPSVAAERDRVISPATVWTSAAQGLRIIRGGW